MSTCPIKIRPFPNPTEITCELEEGHERTPVTERHQAHLRHYAYPGSDTVMTWYGDDRRAFVGEFMFCSRTDGCVLPMLHRGSCAQ